MLQVIYDKFLQRIALKHLVFKRVQFLFYCKYELNLKISTWISFFVCSCVTPNDAQKILLPLKIRSK